MICLNEIRIKSKNDLEVVVLIETKKIILKYKIIGGHFGN
jgi:hypothetical protein